MSCALGDGPLTHAGRACSLLQTFDEHDDTNLVYQYSVQPLVNYMFDKGKGTCFAYGTSRVGGCRGCQDLSGLPSWRFAVCACVFLPHFLTTRAGIRQIRSNRLGQDAHNDRHSVPGSTRPHRAGCAGRLLVRDDRVCTSRRTCRVCLLAE